MGDGVLDVTGSGDSMRQRRQEGFFRLLLVDWKGYRRPFDRGQTSFRKTLNSSPEADVNERIPQTHGLDVVLNCSFLDEQVSGIVRKL